MLTLKLCNCQYIHRDGVNKIITIMDIFISESLIPDLKYRIDSGLKGIVTQEILIKFISA